MHSKHRQKFITNCIIGFILITGGLFLFLFNVSSNGAKDELYIWGAVTIIIINIGLFSLCSAFVHKVKSDFIRKQKQRSDQKSSSSEEF